MNNKHLVLAVVIGVVVFGVAFMGISALSSKNSNPATFGTVSSGSGALAQQALLNKLTLISNPLLGWVASTTAMNNVTVGSTTISTTSLTVTGITPGDYLVFGESTSTANVNLNCSISAANTVICTKTTAVPGSAGIAAVSSTISVLGIPKSTFVSPAGL